MTAIAKRLVPLALLTAWRGSVSAAELVALSPQTWDRYIPHGKEVDGIYGDFALVNDQIMCGDRASRERAATRT